MDGNGMPGSKPAACELILCGMDTGYELPCAGTEGLRLKEDTGFATGAAGKVVGIDLGTEADTDAAVF